MENGLGSVEAPNLVNKAMEYDTMDSKVDEEAEVVYHESKNSEGDQDFEDSLAAEISTVSSENVVSYPVDDLAKAENLYSPIDAHKKSHSEINFEQFQEASEAPDDVDNQEKRSASIEDNGEVFVGMQPVDRPKVAEINNEDGIMEKNEEKVEDDISAYEKTDNGVDFEKFEEAVEVPVDVDNEEDEFAKIEDTIAVFLGVEPADKPVVDKVNNGEGGMEKNEKTDNGVDFEKFEEAVEVPVDVDNEEDEFAKIEDTIAVFLGVEPADKPVVDEVNNGEGGMEKNEKDEFDKVDNDMVVHEKTDSGIDFESFEEAVEDPIEHDNLEDRSPSIEDKREVLVVDNPVVEVVNIGEGVVGKSEVSDITTVADDDKEIMKEEVVMQIDNAVVYDKKIQEDVIVEKHENGVSDATESEGKVASEISDNGHANAEKSLLKEEPKTPQVESLDEAEKGKQTKGILSSLVNVHEDKESFEEEGDVASGTEAKKNSITLNTKLEGEKSCEEIEEVSEEVPNLLHGSVKNEGMMNHLMDREELRHDLVAPIFDHQLTNGKPESSVEERAETLVVKKSLTNGKPESSEEEREETPMIKKAPVFYDVAVEKAEAAQDNASDKGVDRANAGISVDYLSANTKKDEILEEKTEVNKKNTQDVNGPSEIKPVSDLFSTSTAPPAVESLNADTKKDEIAGVTIEADKKNTQGQNGPSVTAPKTNVSANPATPPARPAGLGRAAPLLETAPRVVSNVSNRANGTASQVQNQVADDVPNGEAEEHDETREKLQMIRVKFLRLAHRLGQTPHNVVVAQVLYRLGLAEQLRGRNGGRVAGFSFDRASAMAEQLEANGQEPLDFSCTIMVLGKSGVGKSATINSIFDEVKFNTDAFQHGTKKVQDVVGTVQGIKVRVIDTPGLFPSWSDQRQNEKILLSVKRFIKKTPPDIVLYLDRLDMQTRDSGDMPLLKTITDVFGPSIWFNAIVVLTHAASAPPEGANGSATSYDMFVTNRSHVVQQAIRLAAGDMRLMNPVSLVENHSACRKNRAGQRVLPNGQVWKPHLLLLSFASKILAEANTLLKLQDNPPGRPFTTRTRPPPLPFLLSSLLQSRPSLKLPEEQFGDDDVLDDNADELTDSEDEREFDELPPFKRLTKEQIGKLSKNQKKAYYDELEYREKLFMKKQLKEEKKRRKMMKKMAEMANETPSEYNDEEEGGASDSVPVPMTDLALPASFDSDNPTHRYRYLDTPNQWVVRPVLDSNGWDHDVGYEGVNVEKLFVVKEKIPMSFSGQITKDKKDANMQMEVASTIKHGEGKSTSLGLDMQSIGKDMAYTLRSETKFINFRKNKATAGLSVTKLGDTVSTGVKIEDQLFVNKRLKLVASGGAMTGRGDMAYGGSFEATLRDKDHPLGRSSSSLALSVMDWHGDLAIGGNILSQIPIGRSTNLIARANLNNKGSGQVSVRLNSSEQLQIVLVALIPLIRKVLGHVQMSQFGQ